MTGSSRHPCMNSYESAYIYEAHFHADFHSVLKVNIKLNNVFFWFSVSRENNQNLYNWTG